MFSTLPIKDNNYDSAPPKKNKSFESRNSEDFDENEHDESRADNNMNQTMQSPNLMINGVDANNQGNINFNMSGID